MNGRYLEDPPGSTLSLSRVQSFLYEPEMNNSGVMRPRYHRCFFGPLSSASSILLEHDTRYGLPQEAVLRITYNIGRWDNNSISSISDGLCRQGVVVIACDEPSKGGSGYRRGGHSEEEHVHPDRVWLSQLGGGTRKLLEASPGGGVEISLVPPGTIGWKALHVNLTVACCFESSCSACELRQCFVNVAGPVVCHYSAAARIDHELRVGSPTGDGRWVSSSMTHPKLVHRGQLGARCQG